MVKNEVLGSLLCRLLIKPIPLLALLIFSFICTLKSFFHLNKYLNASELLTISPQHYWRILNGCLALFFKKEKDTKVTNVVSTPLNISTQPVTTLDKKQVSSHFSKFCRTEVSIPFQSFRFLKTSLTSWHFVFTTENILVHTIIKYITYKHIYTQALYE